MGPLPAGECVCREPGVNHTDVGLKQRVREISEIVPQLAGVKLSLVDHCSGVQGADVKPCPRHLETVCRVLAEDKHLSGHLLVRQALLGRDYKDLDQDRHGGPGHLAYTSRIGGNDPPGQNIETNLGGDGLELFPLIIMQMSRAESTLSLSDWISCSNAVGLTFGQCGLKDFEYSAVL